MGVRFIFDGAEVPSHRKVLESMGVTRFGVNYWRLYKRGLPKTKTWLVAERFLPDTEVYLHPGQVPGESRDELFALYTQAIDDNHDRLSGATEFDADRMLAKAQRLSWDDELLWAVYSHENATESLEDLAGRFQHLALPYATLEAVPGLATRTRALTSQYGTVWHGLGCAKPDNLRQVPFTTASTQAWLAPMLRGETLVWDGAQLKRYPSSMKDQARARYRHVYEQAGLDAEAILADDSTEATRLAIWSLLQLEKRLEGTDMGFLSDSNDIHDDPGDAERGDLEPDNSPVPRGTPVRVRNPSETLPIPTLGFEKKAGTEVIDGVETVVERTHVTSQQQSMRQCNTCFVAANCPAFTPDSTCAFNIPIEIKTKDQLKALLQSVIEMQGQRVAFARYAEETTGGGYPDPNVSQEIDRLFKIVESLKRLEDNREFARITVERQGSSGVLSALFGDRAESLKELPQPVNPDLVIKQQIEDS